MPSSGEIAHQRGLLEDYREALTNYLQQQVYFGEQNTPSEVRQGIADTREKIHGVKDLLHNWGVPVEDHPDDEDYMSTQEPNSQERRTTREAAPSEEEVNAYRERLTLYRVTLANYLRQRAVMGENYAPPAVTNGIIDTRGRIRYIKGLLRSWDIPVDDHADDEEPTFDHYNPEREQASVSNLISSQSHIQSNQGNPQPTDEYLKAIEAIRNEMVSIMQSEINGLREDNKKLISTSERLKEDINRLKEVIYPSSIIEGEEDLKEEIRHQMTLRKELIRRLRALELDQARRFGNLPAEVDIEIGDIREYIAKVEARIKILTYDLEQLKSTKVQQS